MKKIAILVVALLALTACVSKYKALSVETPTTKLSKQSSFFVMLPVDGQYNGKSYLGSGTTTAQALASALAQRSAKVTLGTELTELSAGLKKAQETGSTYLIQITILNWEDRATEWSGIPDKLALRFDAYDVATGKQIATSTSKASSKWATLGGDHPQDLLPEPTQEFVNTLF